MGIRFEPFQAKYVMSRKEEPIAFHRGVYSLNPYMGCSMGCRYCYVQLKRHNSSSGLEEEKDSVVQMKINAPYLLEKRLASEPERGLIVIGESCEPYDRPEKKFLIMRNLLEILARYDFPVHIITRSPLVTRDVDVIRQIAENSFVIVTISVPLISSEMLSKFEPDAPPVKERLKALKILAKSGIACGVSLAPLIPYISDGEEAFSALKKASESGALYAFFSPLLIKSYQREMFFAWLEDKYPRLIEPYRRLYGESESPSEEYVTNFSQKFNRKAEDLGLMPGLPLNSKIGSEYRQEFLNLNGL